MKITLVFASVIVLLDLSVHAQADVFNLGAGFTNLETVFVNDTGNMNDTRNRNDRGSVGYNYRIGKYEVTAKQYTDFLNNKAKTDNYGLYNSEMYNNTTSYDQGCYILQTGISGSYSYSVANDWANRPVNYVSYWDACRFVNWLSNGQGDGDTETGTYTLNGYNGFDGREIQRNTSGKWVVPTKDEWWKAGYYKGGGPNAGYWKYPTMSDTLPSNAGSDNYTDPGNHANYWGNNYTKYTIGSPYYRTVVGEFENSASAYGTFDQGGNVSEWIEEILYESSTEAYRGYLGGSYDNLKSSLYDSYGSNIDPRHEVSLLGFRVIELSTAAVPEPSSIIVLACGLAGLLGIRKHQV
jgi:formylglycine-generating enzyme required for sulfatase activity